jgi:23S rRNA (pseudouridine1915-N3)-methyltransferase
MKVELVIVGKTTQKWIKEGFDDYFGRLKHYLPCTIREVQAAGAVPREVAIEKEGRWIMEKINARDWVVLLDEHGKEFSSVQLAELLNKRMIAGTASLVLITGGAFGVSEEIKKRADLVLSASRFTFTHQMIRLIIAEQLYRAMTILKNESYHHI